MKKYTPKHTTNVEVESCVCFMIDGVEIAIYEDYTKSQIHIISGWVNQIMYAPIFEFRMQAYCDYAEFYIEQKDWQTMLITTQFYDGSDKVEAFCDAKTVYEKIIVLMEHYFLEVEKNPDFFNSFPTHRKPNIQKHKEDFHIIKKFYQQHYQNV
ncbi:MAG: hypothetical protein MUC49_15235 [Raineya sp.]|jgi:hypothetical protein|nr:hypothetical protein [Raineya sp.]